MKNMRAMPITNHNYASPSPAQQATGAAGLGNTMEANATVTASDTCFLLVFPNPFQLLSVS